MGVPVDRRASSEATVDRDLPTSGRRAELHDAIQTGRGVYEYALQRAVGGRRLLEMTALDGQQHGEGEPTGDERDRGDRGYADRKAPEPPCGAARSLERRVLGGKGRVEEVALK